MDNSQHGQRPGWRRRIHALLQPILPKLRKKRTWGGLVLLALVATVMVYIIYTTFRGDTLAQTFALLERQVTPLSILGLSLIYALVLLLTSLVWMLIIGSFSGIWDWLLHFRLYCIANITRRLPGAIWHVVGRMAAYEQRGVPRGMIILASGVEFATIVIGGVVASLITWPFLDQAQGSMIWLVLGLVGGVILLNPKVLRYAIRRISKQDNAVIIRYTDLLLWVFLYALVWAAGGLLLFAMVCVIHPLPWADIPALIGVWSLSGVVSFLTSFIPFGLGVTELTITTLLSAYIPMSEALVVALLMRVLLTANEVLWALACGLAGTMRQVLRGQRGGVTPAHPNEENPEGLAEITPR